MTDVADIDRRQARLFAFIATAAAIGLLMGLGFGALLLKGQADHAEERRIQDQRAADSVAAAASSAEDARVISERTEAAVSASQAALDLIKDCTTAGGKCKAQGEAGTARAINEIVTRINVAISGLTAISGQNVALQRQVAQLAAEAAQLRTVLQQQAERPDAPPAPPPPTPGLCQLIRC